MADRLWSVTVDVHLNMEIEAESQADAEDYAWDEFMENQGRWETEVWAEPADEDYEDEG